jgi:sulfide:quinone oxidoreductase
MAFSDIPDAALLGPDPEPARVREPAFSPAARPQARTVLIAGSGPAAMEAALAVRAFGGPHLHVQMLTPATAYVHRPLSVVEPFAAGRVRSYELARLGELGIRVHRGTLASVDAASRLVRTGEGRELRYDFLLVATGAQARGAVPHALTFGGPAQIEAMHGVIQDMEGGWSRRIAFVAPRGATWTLPLYELALQTAQRASDACLDAEIFLVTHERAPLEVFGPTGAELGETLLRDAGVRLITGADPSVPQAGRLVPRPGDAPLDVDRIVALPVPVGRPVPGLPADGRGFLPVDAHGRVRGVGHVYAAGDGTSGEIKQGGLGTQMADAAAESILVDAGLRTDASPFEGVLRATLIAGPRPMYLRRRLREADGDVSDRTMWWPPGKIAGHRLAPFLDALDTEDGAESVERAIERRRSGVRRRVAVVAREVAR